MFSVLQRTRINDTDMHSRTALHLACGLQKAEVVKALLQKQPAFLKDSSGRDPLSYSKQKGFHDILSILEAFTCKANGKRPTPEAVMPDVNMNSISPDKFLKMAKDAITQGAYEVLDSMIRGIIVTKPYLVDMTDPEMEQRTLLHHACFQRQPECVRVLLQYGASPSIKGKNNWETPLHLAASSDVECLRLLVETVVQLSLLSCFIYHTRA
jgi:ankyrin repeat protein